MSVAQPLQEDVQATFCAALVDQWAKLGVRNAFVSPGSRSTPMALALVGNAEFSVEIVHDERSAAFMALGSGLSTGVPAVVLCTSGTAATHFHAAVVEADLSGVPLIVCTADRPPELHGIRSAQTIDQQNLYGTTVRRFVDAGVPEWSGRGQWRQMAADVFGAAVGFERGPVHINLPFREPLVGASRLDDVPSDVETVRDHGAGCVDQIDEIAGLCSATRGVVVAGEGASADKHVAALAEELKWPLIADSRSGLQHVESAICHADSILRGPAVAESLHPDVVLQFGEGPASKILNQFLHDGKTTVVQVSDRLENRDPYRDVSLQVNAEIGAIAKQLRKKATGAGNAQYVDRWKVAESAARLAIYGMTTDELSEPAVACTVAGIARKGQLIVASSSMPVRDLEWYARIPRGVRVIANRGANGIDGVLSTAIGAATSTDKTVYVLIGDIALLHDSSALTALADRNVNMRIVVTNNDGGAIFSFLSQHQLLERERYEQLFGTPHGTDLVKLCKAHNLKTVEADSLGKLKRALGGRGVKVVIVRTDRDKNIADHAAINAAVASAVSSALSR